MPISAVETSNRKATMATCKVTLFRAGESDLVCTLELDEKGNHAGTAYNEKGDVADVQVHRFLVPCCPTCKTELPAGTPSTKVVELAFKKD